MNKVTPYLSGNHSSLIRVMLHFMCALIIYLCFYHIRKCWIVYLHLFFVWIHYMNRYFAHFQYLQSVLCSLHPGHVFSVGQTISAVFGFFFLILYSSTLAALGPTKYMYLYYVIYTKYAVNTCTCMYLKLYQYMSLHTIC